MLAMPVTFDRDLYLLSICNLSIRIGGRVISRSRAPALERTAPKAPAFKHCGGRSLPCSLFRGWSLGTSS